MRKVHVLRLLEDKLRKEGCACGHGTASKDGRDGPQVRGSIVKYIRVLPDDNKQEYRKGFEVQLNETEKPDNKETR